MLAKFEKHTEETAALHEGIVALREHYLSTPAAFASLMAALLRDYSASLERTKTQADEELLEPILEVFQRLQENKSG